MQFFSAATDESATREAYRRWAPLYPPTAHNPLMRAEQKAMLDLWPDVAGGCVLDLACGSGRYSRLLGARGAERVVAVDFCEDMVRQAGGQRVCASMMHLPLRSAAFDAVISGLAVGHASSMDGWMREVARVLAPGGVLLYSDFHADAARAGMTRSFKDVEHRTVTVPHALYGAGQQRRAALAAGLTVDAMREIRVGIELTEPFAGSADFYRRLHGLPIALVVRAHK